MPICGWLTLASQGVTLTHLSGSPKVAFGDAGSPGIDKSKEHLYSLVQKNIWKSDHQPLIRHNEE